MHCAAASGESRSSVCRDTSSPRCSRSPLINDCGPMKTQELAWLEHLYDNLKYLFKIHSMTVTRGGRKPLFLNVLKIEPVEFRIFARNNPKSLRNTINTYQCIYRDFIYTPHRRYFGTPNSVS